jgi:putative heme-binding domain-containing protein
MRNESTNGRGSKVTLLIALAALVISALPIPEARSQDLPTDWHQVTVPDAWRKLPTGDLAPIDGYSWYRCLVRVPESWQGNDLSLYVEALDDARASYFNGINVGATGTFAPQYRSGLGEQGRYTVSADVVRYGQFNVVAIRVYQYDPRPNFSVAPPVLINESAKQAIRMNGTWQYRGGDDVAWATADVEDFSIEAEESIGENAGDRGVYTKVDAVEDIQRYVARRKGDNDPLSPAEAEQQFVTPADLDFQLVLSEPEISQPLFMTWDERGRMWLMEYRQYPEVAGLKMISRDVYLRSVYDQVPKAPPNHVKGRDRISIHEDTDGDGVYDAHKVFVDGLNIATSCAIGRGGVWVTNPPYLLFYPDRNGDDIPDGDPEVHLEGFGLEDSHSVINSIRFGPDGWLYAAQGSTVSAKVKRPGSEAEPIRTMGQQVWRYHPELKRFEVFAEGGGNTFGVEIDKQGQVFSGHNGGDTRGFHYVQGGYYRKGFGKHGPLSNPFAFGYFEDMKHDSVPRFTHNFIIYEADALPQSYHGRLFGVEPLQGQVVMSSFEPDQSSFQTADLSRPVTTEDQWFRPVDIKVGPDGCIYVADMYEQRIDHSSHYAGRIDRTSGRIYRLKPTALDASAAFDYAKLSSEDWIGLLRHPNKWHRQTIIRLLGDRADPSLNEKLQAEMKQAAGQYALELLWALNAGGGLTDEVADELLRHDEPMVRAWTVRLVCDRHQVAPRIARALAELAASEPYVEVRKQLASSAGRLPPADALPIIAHLLSYDQDAADIHQPLLLWWALEAQADGAGRDLILSMILDDADRWQLPLVKQHLLERLMKRYALAGSRQDLLAAARLLSVAPDQASTETLLKGFEDAYQGRSLADLPDELVEEIGKSGGGSTALRLRQGNPEAIADALEMVVDPQVEREQRRQFLQVFGEIRRSEFIPVLLEVVQNEDDEQLISAALTALQSFVDQRVGRVVVEALPRLPSQTKLVAETLLASRRAWSIELLEAVDRGDLKPGDISETALRKILLHRDDQNAGDQIGRLVTKHWGTVAGATTAQMQAEIERLTEIVAAAAGNPKRGKPLYMESCGKCHSLFGEGGDVGPDLTPFRRDDLERMLLNIVNPSIEIREGFENHVVLSGDGRIVNGFLADQDNQVIVLRGVDGQNLIFRRDEVESMRTIKQSVMPEETLKSLEDQQIRDLMAYLRSSQPVNY